jgi:hypothetical protein
MRDIPDALEWYLVSWLRPRWWWSRPFWASGFGRLDWVGVGGFLTGLFLFFINCCPGLWLGFEEENLCIIGKTLHLDLTRSHTCSCYIHVHCSDEVVVRWVRGCPDWWSRLANMSPRSLEPVKHHLELVSYFHVHWYTDCCTLHTVSMLPMAVLTLPIAHIFHSPWCRTTSNTYYQAIFFPLGLKWTEREIGNYGRIQLRNEMKDCPRYEQEVQCFPAKMSALHTLNDLDFVSQAT